MNRKLSLGLTISLIAIGCAITFVLTWTVSLSIFNKKITSSEKFEGVYEKVQNMDTIVRRNYIGDITDEVIETAIINGYVSGIGDPYAYYMPPSSYYEFQQSTNGVVNGAGFEAEPDGSGYFKITHIYKGGSAESNGVLVGDVITEIEGRSLLSMSVSEVQERISGESGTKLSLKLVRDNELYSVTLIRQQTDIESVTYETIAQGIGYIRISTFNNKTAEQFYAALDFIRSHNAKALVIDIRQNGGGVVTALKPMLNRLISAAVVAYAEDSGEVRRTLIETDSNESLNIPTAVLVDGGTASAAELFAVTLRDFQGARLIGTQTRGKGVMQTAYELSDGSAFGITTATIIPAKSTTSYNGVGLKPDYVVELPAGTVLEGLAERDDPQLQKAIEILLPEITEPQPVNP